MLFVYAKKIFIASLLSFGFALWCYQPSLECMKRKNDEIIVIDDDETDNKKQKLECLYSNKRADKKPIIQWESIDQMKIEKNMFGKFKGLCGLFAVYNGLKMLDAMQKGQKEVSCTDQDIKLFEELYERNKYIFDIINKDSWFAVHEHMPLFLWQEIKSLERKVEQKELFKITKEKVLSYNKALPKNIFLISEYNNKIYDNLEKMDYGKILYIANIIENIKEFRENKTPQVVILQFDNHYVSLLITEQETWAMDSLGDNIVNKNMVRYCDYFYREKEQPASFEKYKEMRKSVKTNHINTEHVDVTEIESSDDEKEVVKKEEIPKEKSWFDSCIIF